MWVKVCGLRDPGLAGRLGELSPSDRPDAVGLNFFRPSRRSIDRETARSIIETLPGEIEVVGLFVNASLEDVVACQQDLGLSTVQLHGDEPPGFLADLRQALRSCGSEMAPRVRLLRAVGVGDSGLGLLAGYLETCGQVDGVPDAVLADAKMAGQYGGTGQVAPWSLLRSEYLVESWPPLLLAGGLQPDNVAAAISAVAPVGVDTAGGVEDERGEMSLGRVAEFVRVARRAAREMRREGEGDGRD